ncbi:MAG: NMD3-related protein [Methanomassiliicoccaceae archaeon]|nr:NMD3-related protein [Methanomassiliicoccaceae archaeon]
MFCVKCGKEEETFDGLCMECFLNGKQLITAPHHVDLERCTSCEEFRTGGHWVSRTLKRAVADAAIDSLSVIDGMTVKSAGASSKKQDDRNYLASVDVEGELKGVRVTAVAETAVRIKNTVCQKCSRQLGNYYEATIQIRSGMKELGDELRDETVRYVTSRVENLSLENRQFFITRVEEVRGGVDILLSSISLAKALAKELADNYCAEAKESSKLVGKAPDGSDMYRMTYLVRMPEYHLNDVVIFNNKPYKLSVVGRNGGKIIRLGNFGMTPLRRTDMQSLKVHTKHNDIMKATVVSVSKREIQVLHPVNYSTVDIRIPDGARIGETADVVEVDDVLFFVP